MAAVTITFPTINNLKIVNDLSEVVDYSIKKLNEKTFVYEVITDGEGTLAIAGEITKALEDGIYKINIEPTTEPDETYVKILHIGFINCYTALFSKVVCEGISSANCPSCADKSKINLSNFNLMLQVYFSILKYHENFDSIYTTLNSTEINDLVQLSKIKTNLNKYCNQLTSNCGCK